MFQQWYLVEPLNSVLTNGTTKIWNLEQKCNWGCYLLCCCKLCLQSIHTHHSSIQHLFLLRCHLCRLRAENAHFLFKLTQALQYRGEFSSWDSWCRQLALMHLAFKHWDCIVDICIGNLPWCGTTYTHHGDNSHDKGHDSRHYLVAESIWTVVSSR